MEDQYININLNTTEKIFRKLVDKQIKNIENNKKLRIDDLRRIAKKINTSIFNKNKCAIWNGYISNAPEYTYINFYFRRQKVALHRLLHFNFVGNISDTEFLKFNCKNGGKCCNVYHVKKFKYTETTQIIIKNINSVEIIVTLEQFLIKDICNIIDSYLEINKSVEVFNKMTGYSYHIDNSYISYNETTKECLIENNPKS
jgi:hypothetical protein